MRSIGIENSSENSHRDNHRSRSATFGRKGRFRFLLLLILTMILLLPFPLAAEDLTCSRLPMLMERFHTNHYAMREHDRGDQDARRRPDDQAS